MTRKATRRKIWPPTAGKVARAVIEHQWRTSKIASEIHILIGGDGNKLVDGAGRIFYVVLGACLAQGIGEDEVDVRILRGSVEALHEQAEVERVDETRRLSLISGLHACNRLLEDLTRISVINSAVELEGRLKSGDVRYSSFPRGAYT